MFLVTSLHVSAFMVGVIEGLAESTALIVKVFSGGAGFCLFALMGLIGRVLIRH